MRIAVNRKLVGDLGGATVVSEACRPLVRRPPAPLKALPHAEPANLVLFVPKLAQYLAHPAVMAVARELLDEHV